MCHVIGIPYTIEYKEGLIKNVATFEYEVDEDGAVSSLQLTLVPWDTLVVEKEDTLTAYLTKKHPTSGGFITAADVNIPKNPTCGGFALKVGDDTFPIACPYGTQRSVENTQIRVLMSEPVGKQVLVLSRCVACTSYNNNLTGNPKVFQMLHNEYYPVIM